MNAVEMLGITKRFGALVANDHVDFSLRAGEIHALLGENGAGKSTLMRILYGLYHADAGEVWVNGKLAHIRAPRDAIALGIGMVTQHFALGRAAHRHRKRDLWAKREGSISAWLLPTNASRRPAQRFAIKLNPAAE